jgi:large subunit ribosomal protein L29
MKITEVREMGDGELAMKERDVTRALWKARFDNHSNRLDDTSMIEKSRRDLARIKTVQTERRKKSSEPTL